MASHGSVPTVPWKSRPGLHLCIPAAQRIWGLSVHLIPSGALTLGTIFVSGFTITLMRSGLSTKRSLQTTPPGDSRYVGQKLGAEPGLEGRRRLKSGRNGEQGC